jgi:hypothetical protein
VERGGLTEMTTTEAPVTPARSPRRVTGRHILIGLLAAVVAAALAVVLLITTGQSSQISALRSANANQSQQITGLNKQLGQLRAAQAQADQAAKTRSQAVTANLGVCEQTDYSNGWVSGVTVTSPTLSSGGAVSCPYGQFIPVTPQLQHGGNTGS